MWLGQAGDVGHLLRRLLREQLELLLDRDAPDRLYAAGSGRLALRLEVRAQEADDLQVRVGEIDADLRGEHLGEVLVPLVELGEEALVVDVNRVAVQLGNGHGRLLSGSGFARRVGSRAVACVYRPST